jgi:hypothetical protein
MARIFWWFSAHRAILLAESVAFPERSPISSTSLHFWRHETQWNHLSLVHFLTATIAPLVQDLKFCVPNVGEKHRGVPTSNFFWICIFLQSLIGILAQIPRPSYWLKPSLENIRQKRQTCWNVWSIRSKLIQSDSRESNFFRHWQIFHLASQISLTIIHILPFSIDLACWPYFSDGLHSWWQTIVLCKMDSRCCGKAVRRRSSWFAIPRHRAPWATIKIPECDGKRLSTRCYWINFTTRKLYLRQF